MPERVRVLLDEGVPEKLRGAFSEAFVVETVRHRGWTGLKNGALLRAAEVDFDALVTVDKKLRHPQNVGYGGNQKAGYTYAVDHGWDVVVMLHGDGQYAPEVMQDLVSPIVRGEADAVFGSRMMIKGGARQGGMPLYKYIGNRVLTTSQNAITGLRLSEWHSGYRAYRVSALAALPYVGNSNGFDFDTEIILQLYAEVAFHSIIS